MRKHARSKPNPAAGVIRFSTIAEGRERPEIGESRAIEAKSGASIDGLLFRKQLGIPRDRSQIRQDGGSVLVTTSGGRMRARIE